MDNSADN